MADGGVIDSLVIEIGSKSNTAAKDIDELTTSLKGLKDVAKGGANLTAVNRQLTNLSTALENISRNAASLDRLAEIMRGVGGSAAGLNAATNALHGVARTARTASVDYSSLSEKVRSVSQQFSLLSPSMQKAITSAAKFESAMGSLAGGKIAPTVNQANAALYSLSVGLQKASTGANLNEKEIKELAAAYAALGSPIQKAVKASTDFSATSRKTASTSKQIAASAKESSSAFGSISLGMTGLVAKLGVYYLAFKKLSGAIAGWVTSSNKYIESTNLFAVSMGSFYDEAFAYAELVNEKMGIDPAQWMDAQGTFMLMAKGFGTANEQAYKLSKGLTELAYDISSLKNIEIEEAITKLRSAFAGELEPIRALGLSISQATLQEYALSKGIDEAVTSMTEQEKSLLRAVKVMEDATRIGYVGDLARTLESPANAMRILDQQVTQLGRSLGNVFLPILTQVIPWVQAFTSVLTDAIQALATLVGFQMPEWDYSDWETDDMGFAGVEESISGATGAAKEFKRQLMGIDELTVLQEPSSGGGGGGADLSDWASQLEIPTIWDDQMLADIETKSKELEQYIKDFAERLFDPFKSLDFSIAAGNILGFSDAIMEQFKGLDFASAMWAVWDELVGAIGAGGRLVTEVVSPIWEAMNIPKMALSGLYVVSEAFNAIGDAVRSVTPMFSALVQNGVVPIAEWIGELVSGTLVWFSEQLSEIGDWFERVTPLATKFGEEFGKLVGSVWAFLEPFATDIWQGILQTLEGMIDLVLAVEESWLQLIGVITEDLNPAWERFEEIITPIAEFVDGVLTDVFDNILAPVLDYLSGTVVPTLADTLENLWTNVLVPLGTFVGDVLEPVFKVLSDALTFLWQNVIMPLADFIGSTFAKAFESISKILNETVIPIVHGVIDVISWLWNNILSPVVNFLWDVFGPAFEEVFKAIGGVIDGVSKTIQGLMDFITGVFTLDWELAWQGVVNIFSGIWDTLSSVIKAPLNAVIAIIEGLINKVIDGWNALKRSINSLSIAVPEWLGGGTVGFNLKMSNPISIPRLAEGGFPAQGEMFIAREAGPELVGQIGNRTAVANNDQIVQGITAGVEVANEDVVNAVMAIGRMIVQAIQESDGTPVYIDGQRLTTSQNQRNRMYGKTLQNV